MALLRRGRSSRNRAKQVRATLEGLEDRGLMTTWGIAWADPQQLTLSFAPDGTQVAGQQSQSYQTFNSEIGAGLWEKEILQGIQTWASNANINVGVIADGGQPIGSPGPAQGDPRFGDIRVTAAPLAPGVLATSSPYDPALGTHSGDMIFNSSYDWNPNDSGSYDLLTVALHEAGHVFGFADSSDPTSFMFNVYTGPKTGISSAAVTALKALYGPSTTGQAGSSLNQATQLPNPSTASPTISTTGTLTNSSPAQYYSFEIPSTLTTTTANIAVQTGGISLLTPSITVFDSSGNVVGKSSASGPLDGGTSFNLSSLKTNTRYSVEVSGATNDVFADGAYNLVINPANAAIAGSAPKVTPLGPTPTAAGNIPLSTSGSIVGQNNQTFFSFKTMAANPYGATIQLQQWGLGLTAAQLQVYDANSNLVGSTVSSDPTNQSLTISLSSVTPNSTYSLVVKNGLTSSLGIGTYQIQVSFASTATGSPIVPMATTVIGGNAPNDGQQPISSISHPIDLQTSAGYAANSRYATLGTISAALPQAFYNFNPPLTSATQPQFMIVTVESLKAGGLNSWVSIFDDKGNQVNATCLSNEGGVGVFQIPVSSSVKNYTVEVSAATPLGPQFTGDFYLGVQFQSAGANLGTLASGTLPTATATPTPTPMLPILSSSPQPISFSSGQTRYYQFVFNSNATSGSPLASSYQATIYDFNGNPIASTTVAANQASSITIFLAPGTYTIGLTPVNQSQSLPAGNWSITEDSLSDPMLPSTYKGSGTSSSSTGG